MSKFNNPGTILRGSLDSTGSDREGECLQKYRKDATSSDLFQALSVTTDVKLHHAFTVKSQYSIGQRRASLPIRIRFISWQKRNL